MNVQPHNETNIATLRAYITGFLGSLAITLTAFWLVRHHLASHHVSPSDSISVAVLSLLAVGQLAVQLLFFFHLGRESKPRWNLMMFIFAAVVVIIVVGGSIWIMDNLSYHMTPAQQDQYLQKQDGL